MRGVSNWDKLIEMVRSYLLLPIGIIAISTALIFIKLCDAPALTIASYRMILASLVLAPFACHKKPWRGWEREEIKWFLLSGFFLGLHFAFWIASLKYTSVASSVILVTTHPVFVGIGAWLLLKERIGMNLVAGIALSVLGCAWVSFGDLNLSKGSLLGDGFALLGAIAASGYLLLGRKLRKGQDLFSYIFPVYSTAGLILILLCLIFQESFFGYSSTTYAYLFLLALIPQLIGHSTFNWALKYLPASMVSIAIVGEPIGSTLLAYLILKEGLTTWKIFGGMLILSGILIALRSTSKSPLLSENV